MAEWRVYEADDEYISRKAAIAYIREQSEECHKAFEELGGESGIYADAYNDLADNFCSIPAADVAPVVHGQWEWFDEETGTPITGHKREWGWRCPNCKEELPDNYDDPDCRPEIRHCPNCGAKMDGGDSDAKSV